MKKQDLGCKQKASRVHHQRIIRDFQVRKLFFWVENPIFSSYKDVYHVREYGVITLIKFQGEIWSYWHVLQWNEVCDFRGVGGMGFQKKNDVRGKADRGGGPTSEN